MRYRIYEEFFESLEKKLKRIEKKCKKYGNDFNFVVVGNEIKKVNGVYYKFIIIEVDGTAKINDYECVAILENHEHGNVIRRINTEIDIPKRFMFTDNICEHCNSKRKRKELYIVRNVNTNEFKQVGSDCLKLYTCGLNAEYVASFIDGITELESFDGIVGNGNKYYVSTKEIIGYAIEIIDKIGYINADSKCSTKALVTEMIDKSHSRRERVERVNKMLSINKHEKRFVIDDFNKDNTEDMTNKIVEYYLSIEDNSEFINNIKVILKDEYVDLKNLGFICYLPKGYGKYIEKEIKLLNDKKSSYFGEIGKRYKDIEVCGFDMVTCYETLYGFIYIYKIILNNNDILIWKTSNYYSDEEIRSVKGITFTIKKHSEYKGVEQTEITRCKLI